MEPAGDGANSAPERLSFAATPIAGSRCANATTISSKTSAIVATCRRPVAMRRRDGDSVASGIRPTRLCSACQLTETIPDLSVAGNREKWARLEAAKRRLLYTLDRLGLPYANAEPKLSFDFKADVEPPNNEWRNAGQKEIVYTGHADGKITINIREADDAAREQLRVQFHEAHRTLIGHFHHEIGHYYWDVLVQNRQETKFRQLFGDHNAVPYQDAMNAYYQNGPREAGPSRSSAPTLRLTRGKTSRKHLASTST